MIFAHYWQAFARLSAVYGGTYMLNKPECKVTYVKPLLSKTFIFLCFCMICKPLGLNLCAFIDANSTRMP